MKSARAVPALAAVVAFAAASPAVGQEAVADTVPPPPAFASPRATMFTFLRAVNAVQEGQPEQIDSAIVALDLSAGPVTPQSIGARRVTRDLWAALNHIRQVEPGQLPGRQELRPDETVFVYFPQPFQPDDEAILQRVDVGDRVIALERQADGRWLFSRETVAGINQLAGILATLPAQVDADVAALEEPAWVRAAVPPQLRRGGFLGLRPWQWIGLLAVIFIGLVIDLAVRTVVRPIIAHLMAQFHGPPDNRVLREAVRALGLFAAALAWTSLVRMLYLLSPADDIAVAATGVLAVLAGTWAGWTLIDLVGEVFIARAVKTESRFDDILVPLLRKTAKLFIIALGIVYGAQNLNINIVPLLTGLGIGGLAFAFAAKDTIENLFGSVAVVLDRPFEVGDWVVVGDVEGTVEELGFRSTRIRTFYNSQVTIPNAVLVRATVDNYGRRQYRRWKTYLGVQYDTPPDKLLAFAEGLRELVRRHPYTRKDYYQVWCNDFADSSFNILLYVFHEVPDWSTELRERERLFIDIVRLADRLGVQFAFPTRTVHLFQEQHAEPQSLHAVPTATTDQHAMANGVRAAREVVAQQPWLQDKPGAVQFDTDVGQLDAPGYGGDA